MADTLVAQIAESTQELIAGTIALMPQYAPIINTVTRQQIPKGKNAVEIPRANATSTVVTPTEGDELTQNSQWDLTSTTITPTLRAIKYRISGRAARFSQENVVAMITEEMAMAQGQDIDTDLSAEFANFGTGNDVGSSGTDLSLATLREARRRLKATTRANGGPAPDPIFGVIAPIPEENLLTNLGLQGVVSSTSPWIPAGLSEDVIRAYGVPDVLVGVKMLWDGYMTEDGSGDFICGMYSKRALWFAVSMDWDMEVFNESNWYGPILRSIADYNSGVGAFPLWGAQITADGS